MRIRCVIILCLLCTVAGSVATGLFYHRQNRRKLEQYAELERRNTELVTAIEDSNRDAERFIDAMGTELERNAGYIEDTRALTTKLREAIKVLEGIYTRGTSCRDSNRSSDS